jgi:6-phosphogluconolactonase
MPKPVLRRFADSNALLEDLCGRIRGTLEGSLQRREQASLLVSGGRTPAALFDRLSQIELNWQQVGVGLVDERCVPPDSDDSNEKLVRTRLLHGAAATAEFVPMMSPGPADTRAERAWRRLQQLPRPYDMALLGMGDDGHTASWFPGSPQLELALDPDQPPNCVQAMPTNAPHERLTVNFSCLMQAQQVIVLINGDAKLRVYETAVADGPTRDMPIRAVLRQEQVPVEVYWSP